MRSLIPSLSRSLLQVTSRSTRAMVNEGSTRQATGFADIPDVSVSDIIGNIPVNQSVKL